MADARNEPDDGDHARARQQAAADAHRLVRIDGGAAGRPLSKAQKTFNRWVERIDEQRRRLAEWQAFGETWQSRVAGEYEPLWRRVVDQRIALLKLFDRAYDSGELTRREQARLAIEIVELARDLLADGDERPDVEALHDRHADQPHAEWRAAEHAAAAAGVAQREDDERRDAEAPEAGAAHDGSSWEWHDAHAERDAHRQRRQQARRDRGDAESGQDGDGAGGDGERPRSARAQARFDRRRAAAEGATRSVRDVYRRLASALHPDREPDPVERERKTGLMQRANQAYDDKDLLRLLSLQIEVEQIDSTTLAAVAEQRLLHYNRVLKEQSAELDREIAASIASFTGQAPRTSAQLVTPATLLGELQQDLAALRRESQQLVGDLAAFKDVWVVKGWLRAVRGR